MSSAPFPLDHHQNLSSFDISSPECSLHPSFPSALPTFSLATPLSMPFSQDSKQSDDYFYPKSHTITTGSRRMSMDVGNVAYTQLYQRCTQLEEELKQAKTQSNNAVIERDTYKNAYALLAQSIQSTTSTTSTSPVGNSFSPLFSATQQSLSIRDRNWPKPSDFTVEELKKIYWYKSAWTTHLQDIKGLSSLDVKKGSRGRSRASEGINVQMLYVVDQEGTPVDGHRAGVMRATARSIWSQLSVAGIAPVKWMSDQNLAIGDHYRSEMCRRFEELRICENGWKVDQIAIDYYPSWRNSQQNRGNFNGNKENEIELISDSEGDVKLSVNTVSQKRKATGKKTHDLQEPKRRKGESDVKTVPAVTKVKENLKVKLVNPLENASVKEIDELGTSNLARPRPRPIPITTSAASPSSAITSPPMSAASSAASPASLSPASTTSLSSASLALTAAASSASPTSPSLASPACTAPLAPALSAPALSVPALSVPAPLAPAPSSLAPSSLTTSLTAASSSPASPDISALNTACTQSVSKSTTDSMLGTGTAVVSSEKAASRELPPIPRMLKIRIPALATPEHVAEMPATTKKKNTTRILAQDKPIAPGDKPTARNFCIRDWCAANLGGTQGEFKMYWDSLTGIDKKKYQDMEKKAKSGKR